MDVFQLLSILTTLAAVFSWLNHRYVGLPTTIGLLALSLLFSLILVALGGLGFAVVDPVVEVLEAVDFDRTLLHGMLGALLFAGALHVDLNDLARQKWVIGILATVGVVLSTSLVGLGAFAIFQLLGLGMPLLPCLLFGALISPTDPIAVLAILKHVAVPKSLEVKIAGESLFNDGIAVVLFIVLLDLGASHGGELGAGEVVALLAEEALGGVVFGAVIGGVAYRMLKSVDSYQVEILITLALVTGGYALAQLLHTSGPLAMVVAGLLVGNHGRRLAMSTRTCERLDSFWELADEFLNAILFLLIGLELLVVTFNLRFLVAGVLAIPLVLASRWISVSVPVLVLRRRRAFSPHVVKLLTWSGLRGGISVALALSLPAGPERELLVATTYVVVAFSILVQGLSIEPLLARLYARSGGAASGPVREGG
jgi:CPA1 family monovalent cation:H+ antiporter